MEMQSIAICCEMPCNIPFASHEEDIDGLWHYITDYINFGVDHKNSVVVPQQKQQQQQQNTMLERNLDKLLVWIPPYPALFWHLGFSQPRHHLHHIPHLLFPVVPMTPPPEDTTDSPTVDTASTVHTLPTHSSLWGLMELAPGRWSPLSAIFVRC